VKRLLLYVLLLLGLLAFMIHKSGTIEKVERRVPSDVPGVPERTAVQYQFHWDRLARYAKSFLPR